MLTADTIDDFMAAIHLEFLGLLDYQLDVAQQELFKLKCCSFKPQDLDKYYQNFVQRYHTLGRRNDANLRQVYLTSIPEPLSQEVIKVLEFQ